jgi:hypothetical protein
MFLDTNAAGMGHWHIDTSLLCFHCDISQFKVHLRMRHLIRKCYGLLSIYGGSGDVKLPSPHPAFNPILLSLIR